MGGTHQGAQGESRSVKREGVMSDSVSIDSAMAAVRAEIEAYAAAQGIDADEFLANLDAVSTADLFDNPTFEAYFQLAYMQLMELLYPEVINSYEAEVGGEVDFDALYAYADDDINALIQELLADDPELAAYFTLRESGETEADYLMALLDSYYETGGDEINPAIQAAYDLAEEYGMESITGLADQELLFESVQQSILDMLAEYDLAIADLVDAFHTGELTETEYGEQMGSISFYRETLLAMLTQVTSQESTFFEMISELYAQSSEMTMAILNNIRSY